MIEEPSTSYQVNEGALQMGHGEVDNKDDNLHRERHASEHEKV